MVSVDAHKYENLDKAIRAFKSKVRKAHIIELSNQKSHFVSRSEKRRRRKKLSRRQFPTT